MQVSRIGSRGRTTIPKAIRDATGLHEGDVIAFAIEGDRLVLQEVPAGQHDYLRSLGTMMGEWLSPEDEEAWRDL